MRTAIDCLPCLTRQALEAVRQASPDPDVHLRLMRHVLTDMSDMDLEQTPVVMSQRIQRAVRQVAEARDPYAALKSEFNRTALDLLPELRLKLATSEDPLLLALRLAIAGNVIDLGVKGGLSDGDIRHAMQQVLDAPFHGEVRAFRRAVRSARRILYLADNAGEIVFDRLLIEQLPMDRIVLAVRGTPVLNDATQRDAQTAGLTDLVPVIDNGSDAPGTLLDNCSAAFRRRFESADLILAKGQGNFETLIDEPAPLYFLLKVKCPVIADHVGLPVGTHVAMPRHALPVEPEPNHCQPPTQGT